MKKPLYKLKEQAAISGVIAGLYDYFDIYEKFRWKLDGFRLVIFILALVTNIPFVLIYLILAILLPDKSEL